MKATPPAMMAPVTPILLSHIAPSRAVVHES